MPHSIQDSADSNSTYSVDVAGPMPSNSSQPGAALSPSRRTSTQSLGPRGSRPGPEAYANLVGKGNFDEFLQKHLGGKNSMMASYNNSSQQRKQYYEEHFQYKDNVTGTIRERVQREAILVAELRTNVIIKDEFTLVTDLSYHLAARYTKPDSSIMIKVDHSACLAMGGTFDPCYLLTIMTGPNQLGPTMNKRNAALIQSFMADILSVPPSRGIVTFVPIPEENFATNGTTMLGEIEKQEKQQTGENGGTVRRAMTSAGRKSMPSFKKSMPRLETEQKRADSKSPEPVMASSPDNRRNTTSLAVSTAVSPVGVFELPATESEKKRPATSHAHSSSSGSNGHKLNPKSPAKWKGRPRTFSGAEATSIQAQIKSNAASIAASAPPPIRLSSRPPSFLKSDPTKLQFTSRPMTPRQRHSGAPPEDRPRVRDSYLDGLLGKPTAIVESGAKTSIEKRLSKEKQSKERERKANMAKRRSTITATPKIMEAPPIPDNSDDKKSIKSVKLGKRKSFLSAFRSRTATPTPASS